MEISERGRFLDEREGSEIPSPSGRSVACPLCFELIPFDRRKNQPVEPCLQCGKDILLHPERKDLAAEGLLSVLKTDTIEDLLALERLRHPIEFEEETIAPGPRNAVLSGVRWGCLLLALVGLVVFAALRPSGEKPGLSESPAVLEKSEIPPDPREADVPPRTVDWDAEAESVVQAFLDAGDWEEKSRFVRDSERVGPLLKEYYSRGDELAAVEEIDCLHTHRGVDGWVSKVAVRGASGPLRGFAVEHGPDGSKIEWESHVCYGEIDWERFVRDQPRGEHLFRVVVSQAPASDLPAEAGNFLDLRIEVPGRESVISGRAPMIGGPGIELAAAFRLSRARLLPVIVRLRHSEDDSALSRVEVRSLEQVGWRIPSSPARLASHFQPPATTSPHTH